MVWSRKKKRRESGGRVPRMPRRKYTAQRVWICVLILVTYWLVMVISKVRSCESLFCLSFSCLFNWARSSFSDSSRAWDQFIWTLYEQYFSFLFSFTFCYTLTHLMWRCETACHFNKWIYNCNVFLQRFNFLQRFLQKYIISYTQVLQRQSF